MATLVLWDIDGTLVHCGDAGREALELAAARAAGLASVPRVKMSGKTDPQIIIEILVAAGLRQDEAMAILPVAVAEAEAILAASTDRISKEGRPHPGVRTLLSELAKVVGVRQTVVTGNILPNALCKIRTFGLDTYLDVEVGAYGTDHSERDRLVPICLDRVREVRGETYGLNQVWVIGDTERDLSCARAAGIQCMLVGTGGGGYPSISDLDADVTVPDLTDTPTILEVLCSNRSGSLSSHS
jgi:phosphoglycolate phosphatase-like HAD superfamily hydrolase